MIDGMRALAALLVFGYHVALAAGRSGTLGALTSYLDVGVAIFFAISGFLLYRPMLASRRGGTRRPVLDYARARVLRIVPAYWVALTLAWLGPALITVPPHRWWVFYGLLQDYGHDALLGLPQAWSLSVEATFYIVLPVFAIVMAAVAPRRRWLRLEVAVLLGLGLAGILVQPQLQFYGIVGTLDWFAVGMLLAALSQQAAEGVSLPRPIRQLAARPNLCWGLAAATYLVMCWLERRSLGADAGYYVKTLGDACVAALLLIPATLGARGSGVPGAVLERGGVAPWLGTISYGIFLYHLPVLALIAHWGWQNALFGHPLLSYTVLGLAMTVPLAALSWYAIERPALRLKRRPPPAPPRSPEAVPRAAERPPVVTTSR
jgi:peptidoglycan/LPS O-acetylase OafA/YrhL